MAVRLAGATLVTNPDDALPIPTDTGRVTFLLGNGASDGIYTPPVCVEVIVSCRVRVMMISVVDGLVGSTTGVVVVVAVEGSGMGVERA